MSGLRDAPCTAPVYDEWRPAQHAGSWRWEPRDRPSGDDAPALNPWAAGVLLRTLDALRPLSRIRSALPNCPPGHLPPAALRWDGRSHAAFEQAVVAMVRGAAVPVTALEIELDLYVWFRHVPASPPALAWLETGARLDLQFERADPYGALQVDHTLFLRTGTGDGALARLNQPLLADALARITAGIGPIVHVEGLPGVAASGCS